MCILQIDRNNLDLKVSLYLFEKVTSYIYLVVNINNKNNVHKKDNNYSLLKLFR